MSTASRVRLTRTGTVVAMGGVSFVVVGLVSGYGEFTVLGLTALVVCAVCSIVPRLTSPIRFHRRDVPRLVERGASVTISLVAEAERPAPGTRIVEQLSGLLIPVDVPRVDPSRPLVVTYSVRATRRGAQQLGPILEERTDPFMIASRTVEHDVIDHIVVHPVIHHLRLPDAAHRAREALEAQARLSDDPVAEFRSLREYVPGDDQRRIHWPTTARTGTVVVRDTFELRRAAKTVVLETLDRAATDALFEDAAEIAASIVCESMRRQVTVVARTRDVLHPGRRQPLRNREEALELFGRVRRTVARDTIPAAGVIGRSDPSDQVILVAGAASPMIAQLCASGSVARRLLVIRLVDGSAPAPRLAARYVDVRSVEHFLSLWRSGQVPA